MFPCPVSVTTAAKNTLLLPITIIHKGRSYPVTQLGLHHTYSTGGTLQHVFSGLSHRFFFRLRLDTSNLQWFLDSLDEHD